MKSFGYFTMRAKTMLRRDWGQVSDEQLKRSSHIQLEKK